MNDAQLMHAVELDDAYRVVEVLAQGATGTTELVMLGESGPYVRKRMPLELANRAAWAAAMGVSCPRVPRVVAMYEMPDQLVVVCEHVRGISLETRVSEAGPLGWRDAVAVALDLCEAAGALHAVGVIHRDISPRNVILSDDGAHLIDLGIARTRTAGAPRDTTLLGTWGFASPEQYGFAQSDERSDVYAIGRVLVYMLTGVVDDATPAGEMPPLDQTTVPKALQNAIRVATSFEPSARFASAEALARALRSVSERAARPTPEPAPAIPAAPAEPAAATPATPAEPETAGARARRLADALRLVALPPVSGELPVRDPVSLGSAWETSATWEKVTGALAFLASFAGVVLFAGGTFASLSTTEQSAAFTLALGALICAFLFIEGFGALKACISAGTYVRNGKRLRRWLLSLVCDAVLFVALIIVAAVLIP